MQDTFAHAVASARVPRVQVVVHDPSLISELLEIETNVLAPRPYRIQSMHGRRFAYASRIFGQGVGMVHMILHSTWPKL